MDGYHPSKILKLKRQRREREAAKHLAQQPNKKEERKLPKLIAESMKYLEDLADLATKIESIVGDMIQITNSALKSSEAPNFKDLNKQFQDKKRELDHLVKEPMVMGEAPFSGKYAQKPKVIYYDERADPFELKFDSYSCKALLIDQLRIDSLSYAKTAKPQLDRAKEHIKEVHSPIGSKLEVVGGKIAALAITESVTKNSGVRGDEYIDLKISQEQAARAKGRHWGLLVNIKV